jgi:prepilin-type N-terminal cleavage/methylation domain-containing protein
MTARLSGTRRAFSLLEVLLAIAVAGLLIGASSYMIVSFSAIWTLRADDDSFEEHADGVAVFLRRAFSEATSRRQPTYKAVSDSDEKDEATDAEKTAATESATSDGLWKNVGVTMARIDEASSAGAPTLHFHFFQFPPALGEAEPPTSLGVEAWLKFDEKRGLSLVWKDNRSRTEGIVSSDKDLLRTSVISSFVTKIAYIYRDDDLHRWEEYDEPHSYSDTYPVPVFIRLTFTLNGREIVRTIHVEATTNKMPRF